MIVGGYCQKKSRKAARVLTHSAEVLSLSSLPAGHTGVYIAF